MDALTVISIGKTIEAAIDAGISEVTEPDGPHKLFTFHSFEIVRTWGGIKKGHRAISMLNVEMRFFGTHKEGPQAK